MHRHCNLSHKEPIWYIAGVYRRTQPKSTVYQGSCVPSICQNVPLLARLSSPALATRPLTDSAGSMHASLQKARVISVLTNPVHTHTENPTQSVTLKLPSTYHLPTLCHV